ncbi:substrate-binding periplasmic protein [Sphaerotilus microaerophilus]|uniref:Amino acid ABC transporter substrate-binding protein n=1 Tax=Sphaerotilus microaerophilus TaxID=2914710 RepID=A0ABM7YKS9_9BURK|nr:transporter substrate-binding domain-containing protein [Sphaerotilus sp. FB-5]BDI04991.1 amino acid ABC transporter substrate-binding protein [Sphaerotilus sp. FB-5]
MTVTTRRRLLTQLGGLTTLAAAPSLARADETALERVRRLGRLTVGVYHDLPPFHVQGVGIEVQLASALARQLGVQSSLLPFLAGENMDDDLRNMVWRGHYLGWGPADVLLHVPVDRPLMISNPKVQIFGPYWRERVVIARDLAKLPTLDSLDPLVGQPVAVPGLSLAGWLMIGAEGGRLSNHLVTKLDNGVTAARMLQEGKVVAAAGLRSELESALRGDARFEIGPLPIPRAPRDGWAVGMAVRKEATDLAQALQGAVEQLSGSGEMERLFAAGGLRWQRV